MGIVSKEQAQTLLGPVAEDKKFWCSNGNVFSSLEDLEAGLATMHPDTFSYHANAEKNDFSAWIAEVIGDAELATLVKKSKTMKVSAKRISTRIKNLRNVA